MKKILAVVFSALILASGTILASSEENFVPENSEKKIENAVPAEEIFDSRNAAILGVVEGLTEYLPISSTGHLIIANRILGLNSDAPLLDRGVPEELEKTTNGEVVSVKNAADAYSIIIQFGAIIAVIFAYWKRVSGTIFGILRREKTSWLLSRNLVIAFVPAAGLGFLFSNKIEEFLFNPISVALALIFGGILMLVVERRQKKRASGTTNFWSGAATGTPEDSLDLYDLSPSQSLLIGAMQCLALWPGMSRSMSTIVGGYLAGLSPRRATEYSFLLGVITLSAASIYKTLKSYTEMLDAFGAEISLIGLFIAFVASFASVKWLVEWISKHGLSAFAWYRFALAAAVLLWAFFA